PGPGGCSPPPWHTAAEVLYVLEGSGHSLHWRVEAHIQDRLYARINKQPDRYDWEAGDLVYVPENTMHQHFAGPAGATLLSSQNRLYKLLGYDAVRYLEPAAEA